MRMLGLLGKKIFCEMCIGGVVVLWMFVVCKISDMLVFYLLVCKREQL